MKKFLFTVLLMASGAFAGMPRSKDSKGFIAGTNISVPSGSKAIESFNVGDQISSYDKEGNLQIAVVSTLFAIHGQTAQLSFSDGTKVTASINQPFFRFGSNEIVEIRDMKVGDSFSKINSTQPITLTEITVLTVQPIYNMRLRGLVNNYFVNGVKVHN